MEAKLALQQQSIDLLKARLKAMQDKEAKWVEQRTRLETQLTHAIKWSMPNGPDSEDESKPSINNVATATKSPRYKIMKEIRSRNGSTVPVGATKLVSKSIDSAKSSDVPAPPREPPSTGVQVMVAEGKLKSNLKSILKKRPVQNPQVIEVSGGVNDNAKEIRSEETTSEESKIKSASKSEVATNVIETDEENVHGREAIKVDEEEELEAGGKTSSIGDSHTNETQLKSESSNNSEVSSQNLSRANKESKFDPRPPSTTPPPPNTTRTHQKPPVRLPNSGGKHVPHPPSGPPPAGAATAMQLLKSNQNSQSLNRGRKPTVFGPQVKK
mmetsp:Transcript_43192/g.70198  ORF Transcript_43192/g.70198 Transcript_43192/m.70198 type:complete len:327 (-) Transcript_43192:64-1044(-)